MLEHTLWVKPRILPLIESGSKSLEVRLSSEFMNKIEVHDILLFNESVRKRVKEIRKYSNLEDVLLFENPFKILPGHDIMLLRGRFAEVWKPGRDKNGVLVFELEPAP